MKKRTFAVDIDGTITENGGGRIHLDALEALRCLNNMGHNVIFVTGRSSVEGFLLSVFGGTGKIAVGENGGCITIDSNEHILLGNIEECKNAFQVIKSNVDGVKEKPVFPRMTEVVLERTFDLDLARKVVSENNLNVELSDSLYAYHINSSGIDKGTGISVALSPIAITSSRKIDNFFMISQNPVFKVAKTSIALGNASEEVKSEASMIVSANAGDGVLEALDKLAPKLSEI
ncbi:MAG TPA: HAD hydrolase family protein [Nitrosopumilus sp.]|nr:HAD hydrolase family protein [Thermoproteota archaeon]HJJ23657.1 HAD hydrolase family protein [Nitrosopumilus sp.]